MIVLKNLLNDRKSRIGTAQYFIQKWMQALLPATFIALFCVGISRTAIGRSRY